MFLMCREHAVTVDHGYSFLIIKIVNNLHLLVFCAYALVFGHKLQHLCT